MRASANTDAVTATPAGAAELTLAVQNTAPVIDALVVVPVGFRSRDDGKPILVARPTVLALFPDAEGTIEVTLELPPNFPAGEHRVALDVASQNRLQPAQRVPFLLTVPPRPELAASVRPERVRARRQGSYVLQLANTGNIGLDVAIRAADADRALTIRTGTDRVYLEAGASAKVRVIARGPRMLFGAEVDRPMTIEVNGRAVTQASELTATASASPVLRQRPLITRGLLTALILPAIVALWAAAFLLGANRVFNNDPMTKAVPASFYASVANASGGAGGGSGGGSGASGAAAAAPAGALPKTGQLPAGVGGTISGKVTAASDGSPVGRLEIDALRTDSTGALVVVSSGATQADGTYSIAGLFPGPYLIRASADGFDTVWFPAVADQSAAVPVTASAQNPVADVNIVITGQPASISGTVSLGATLSTVPVTVAARALTGPAATAGGSSTQAPAAQALTAANGSYALTNLPAPGSYEITFTATGYQPSTIVETLTGGQARIEAAVQLSAGDGQVSGQVTDGSKPLGGVTISTTVAGNPVTTGTPTTGAVGAYVLPNLPTPGTYLITYSLAGYGSRTIVVDLSAGQSQTGVNVAIQGGTGTVSGRVVDTAGNGVGGATIAVGGGASAASTTTLTSGSVGTFVLAGLPAPGAYTLTVTMAGYAAQTVPVTLSGAGAPPTVSITLPTSAGSLLGIARLCDAQGDTCAAALGATVSATNGTQTFTTTTTASGTSNGPGGYTIGGLAPGTYAVTVTAAGYGQLTALATITAGAQTTVADLNLVKAS
jgi:hypothetical protein